ncbi:MAG: hypothetical protein WCW53_12230, partial [Syntrophales bacterium]
RPPFRAGAGSFCGFESACCCLQLPIFLPVNGLLIIHNYGRYYTMAEYYAIFFAGLFTDVWNRSDSKYLKDATM